MWKSALVFFCSVSLFAQDASVLKKLQYREVGPYRGGRADAVARFAWPDR